MAISRQKKEEVVKELQDALGKADVVVFTDYKGTDVNTLTDLRNKVRQSGGRYLVAKKTLIKHALGDNIKGFDPLKLEGQIGLGFGFEDSVATAKVVHGAQLNILGGIMGEKLLSAQEVIQLAQLPTREELVAKVVGTIAAPLSGFANVLRGNFTEFLYALNAIKEQKN